MTDINRENATQKLDGRAFFQIVSVLQGIGFFVEVWILTFSDSKKC